MKGGSKNNIANRGSGAKAKFYNGKKVIAGLIDDKKSKQKFIAAFYEDETPVKGPDGKFVKYDAISTESAPTA